ncbi:sugar phosphate nucleotidyltransferase, partial [Rhizobium ruizarguesonis]
PDVLAVFERPDIDGVFAGDDGDIIHSLDGKLVNFGITPTEPAKGYGYIEIGDELKNGAHKVKRFVEKPALEKAEQML